MESDKWLTIADVCRKAQCPKDMVERLITEGRIPSLLICTIDGVTRLHKGVATMLKNKKSSMFNDEQPKSAVHVEDPDGVYPGFWLTPEQAMTLAEIRVTKRLTGQMAYDTKVTLGILQDERWKCKKQR